MAETEGPLWVQGCSGLDSDTQEFSHDEHGKSGKIASHIYNTKQFFQEIDLFEW